MELFEEMQRHLVDDEKPSEFIKKAAFMESYRRPPFTMIFRLSSIEQSPKYHPEGDALIHTLLVVDEAAKLRDQSTDPVGFMWAALLHDIGKFTTTRMRKGRITSYDHDREGGKLAAEFMSYFPVSQEMVDYVSGMVRFHMHILYINQNLPFGQPKELVRQVPVKDVALLGFADRMGRLGADKEKETKEIRQFKDKMKKYH
ncbi:tRNA nucleotidyltransferase [Lachnospiraceae bacterium KM106-2]|nr:tRNA nucleotidyltransferase [Lachnospiraceae bacterium KM106-2]